MSVYKWSHLIWFVLEAIDTEPDLLVRRMLQLERWPAGKEALGTWSVAEAEVESMLQLANSPTNQFHHDVKYNVMICNELM